MAAAEQSSVVNWPDALDDPRSSLKVKVEQGLLPVLDLSAFRHNWENHSVKRMCGGEAVVLIVEWHVPPASSGSSGGGSSGACPIREGQRVALKVHHAPNGRGGFRKLVDEYDVQEEAWSGMIALRNEVNALMLLDESGFGDRVPPVLGIVQHQGNVRDLPLYAYAMPAYRYGSLAGLIQDTCDRRVPDSLFADFFSPRRATSEYHKLMEMLQHIHSERGYMLQDISSNNLLVSEQAGGGCRLLLADPSMTKRICDLANPDMKGNIVSTWLWGSSTSSYRCFDPTADNYGLSFCFLELWLCAEGAPCGLTDLLMMTGSDGDRDTGRTFVRALCAAVLHRQACCPGVIVPRIKRELPVSWLMLWLLLLGTEDYTSKARLESQQAHRRPAEADMVDAAAELAGVAAGVEAMGGGLSAESLATPAGEALVAHCLRLYERLTSLSQLEPPQGSPLVPLDASLSWVATHFMAQDHPLVAAMRAAQGAAATTEPPTMEPVPFKTETFFRAVEDLQNRYGCSPYQGLRDRDKAMHYLRGLCQEYVRCLHVACELLPTPEQQAALLERTVLPDDLQRYVCSVLPPAPAAAAAAAAATSPAVQQPAQQPGVAGQAACQPPRHAGPPSARPLGAGPHSMPQLHAAPRPLSAPTPHPASMPAQQLAGIAGLIADGPAVAPAGLRGLPAASMPALPAGTADAAPAGPPVSGACSLPGSSATAGAAADLLMASHFLQPGASSRAPSAFAPSGHMPGSSAEAAPARPSLQDEPSPAAGVVPRWSAASLPPSLLQHLPALPPVAGTVTSPSADLSSRTVAGGPGDASPATSGGSGLSSPNKRKRGAAQVAALPAPEGTVLRFAVSRACCVAGLPAFRLPPNTNGSNLYAYIVAQLSERFRGDVHQLLAQRQSPYSALLAASGLQPAQLDSLVAGSGDSSDAYIEVSAASFLPGISADDHAAAAPIIFHSSSRGRGGREQQIECGDGSTAEQARYSTAVRAHLKQCQDEDMTPAFGGGSAAVVLFRIAALQLPQGTATMPWVQHEWAVPAADVAAVVSRAKHIFRKR